MLIEDLRRPRRARRPCPETRTARPTARRPCRPPTGRARGSARPAGSRGRATRSRCMISCTCSTSRGDRPSDGSSIRMSSGLAISARPMASICCSPPLSAPPGWSIRSASWGNSCSTSSKFQRLPAARPPAGAEARASTLVGSSRFSRTLERAEDAPALRHDRDALLGDGIGRLAAQRDARGR